MTDLAIFRPTARATLSPSVKGALFGLGAVVIWGSYLALARAGVSVGLSGADFAFIRYATAGLVMLPWLLMHEPATLAGVGWKRGAVLAVFAGPLFILLGIGGYAFAPLAHGAVVQPATVVIATTALAWFFLKDNPPRERLIGIAIMVIGLAVIAGPALLTGSSLTPLGDAMFAGAGLARRWGIKALPATAALSVISALVVVPVYVLTQDFSRLAALPLTTLATQILVQGMLSGVVAVVFFTRAAELSGPAKAAIFPALVPVAAILIGIPVTGEWPTMLQLAGLVIVSLGLGTAIGLLGRRK
jgi:drug/metabolite transporter (DMT)-like permease